MKSKTNLSGQKIDMLLVKELVVASPYSKKSYRCECDCGNECIRLEASLKRKTNKHSCGCIPKKNLIPGNREKCSKAGKNRKNSFVNGSNVQMTFREGTIKTNTSGVQGVSWSKTVNKWHVYVGYKKYRANLGYYESLNDAKFIREKAEQAIKDNTFEDFFYSVRGFQLGERNSQYEKKRSL